jgi:hypothetical protein
MHEFAKQDIVFHPIIVIIHLWHTLEIMDQFKPISSIRPLSRGLKSQTAERHGWALMA